MSATLVRSTIFSYVVFTPDVRQMGDENQGSG